MFEFFNARSAKCANWDNILKIRRAGGILTELGCGLQGLPQRSRPLSSALCSSIHPTFWLVLRTQPPVPVCSHLAAILSPFFFFSPSPSHSIFGYSQFSEIDTPVPCPCQPLSTCPCFCFCICICSVQFRSPISLSDSDYLTSSSLSLLFLVQFLCRHSKFSPLCIPDLACKYAIISILRTSPSA